MNTYALGGFLHLNARDLGVELSEAQLSQFELLADLLESGNQVMNLTNISKEETPTRHFLDSLSVAQAVDLMSVRNLIDIGTGAGFPGLPLKIAFPHLKVTLVDSTLKKVKFVEQTATKLGLTGVKAIHNRAETLASQGGYRNAFSVVVARAVAPMEKLAGWLKPFTAPGGCIIAMKGPAVFDELARLPQSRDWKVEVRAVESLPDLCRVLVVIRRTGELKPLS